MVLHEMQSVMFGEDLVPPNWWTFELRVNALIVDSSKCRPWSYIAKDKAATQGQTDDRCHINMLAEVCVSG